MREKSEPFQVVSLFVRAFWRFYCPMEFRDKILPFLVKSDPNWDRSMCRHAELTWPSESSDSGDNLVTRVRIRGGPPLELDRLGSEISI